MPETNEIVHVQIGIENGEILEFRNNETLDFYTSWEQAYDMRGFGYLYAVRVVDVSKFTPQLPGRMANNDTGLTIIACRQFEVNEGAQMVWGWVYLSQRSKESIGDILLRIQNAFPEQWIFMVVRQKIEPQDSTLTFKAEGLPYPIPFWINVERLAEDSVNFTCRIDLNLCPESFKQKLLDSSKNRWMSEALEDMGFTNISALSVIY